MSADIGADVEADTNADTSDTSNVLEWCWGSDGDWTETAGHVTYPSRSQVIELAYFGGFTHTEIAEMLQTPVGTIANRGTGRLNVHFQADGDLLNTPSTLWTVANQKPWLTSFPIDPG
jgi:hypothetical protein